MTTKKVYLVNVVPLRDKAWTPTEHLHAGSFYVYGDDEMRRCENAAKAAGVTLNVRPAPKD